MDRYTVLSGVWLVERGLWEMWVVKVGAWSGASDMFKL